MSMTDGTSFGRMRGRCMTAAAWLIDAVRTTGDSSTVTIAAGAAGAGNPVGGVGRTVTVKVRAFLGRCSVCAAGADAGEDNFNRPIMVDRVTGVAAEGVITGTGQDVLAVS